MADQWPAGFGVADGTPGSRTRGGQPGARPSRGSRVVRPASVEELGNVQNAHTGVRAHAGARTVAAGASPAPTPHPETCGAEGAGSHPVTRWDCPRVLSCRPQVQTRTDARGLPARVSRSRVSHRGPWLSTEAASDSQTRGVRSGRPRGPARLLLGQPAEEVAWPALEGRAWGGSRFQQAGPATAAGAPRSPLCAGSWQRGPAATPPPCPQGGVGASTVLSGCPRTCRSRAGPQSPGGPSERRPRPQLSPRPWTWCWSWTGSSWSCRWKAWPRSAARRCPPCHGSSRSRCCGVASAQRQVSPRLAPGLAWGPGCWASDGDRRQTLFLAPAAGPAPGRGRTRPRALVSGRRGGHRPAAKEARAGTQAAGGWVLSALPPARTHHASVNFRINENVDGARLRPG